MHPPARSLTAGPVGGDLAGKGSALPRREQTGNNPQTKRPAGRLVWIVYETKRLHSKPANQVHRDLNVERSSLSHPSAAAFELTNFLH
jgi:hypothetical protein